MFGLAHFSRNEIERAFPEFRDSIGQCRFRDCKHLHEPNCALQTLVADGKASGDRLSYLRKFCAEGEAVPLYARTEPTYLLRPERFLVDDVKPLPSQQRYGREYLWQRISSTIWSAVLSHGASSTSDTSFGVVRSPHSA